MRCQQSVFLLGLLLFAAAASGQSATSTRLAVTAGGSALTTVQEETVVTLTATVLAGSTPVTPGLVEFCEVKAQPLRCTDIRLLGTAQLTAGGTAVLRFFPAAGVHTYEAVFVGTHSAATSSQSKALTVSPFFPTVTTIPPANILALGPGTYTFDVSVTGSGGTSAPTGTVSILDTSNRNYPLGTAPLIPGSGGGTGKPGSGFSEPILTPMARKLVVPVEMAYTAVADFNGDGKQDIAVGDPMGNSVTALLGNGDGTFSLGSSSTAGSAPRSIAVADFSGDGKPDLVVVNSGSGTVSVLLGNGDGTFAAAKTLPVAMAPAPTFVAVGDFNGDGIPDIAVANATTPTGTAINAVTILLGNGDGTFTLKSTLPTGNDPVSIAVGDFNGDGNLDPAVANRADNTLTILLGNGDGTFTSATSPTTGTTASPSSIVAADFNGDGILDIAVANAGNPDPNQSYPPGSVAILQGNGDGTFTRVFEPLVRGNLISIAAGDFNADGKVDLVVTDAFEFRVMLGNGDGTFGAATAPDSVEKPMSVATGDFNGDGVSDIVSPGYYPPDSGIPPDPTPPQYVNVLLAELGSSTSMATSTATVGDFFVVGTGIHQLIASYGGDSNYAPSVSGPEGVGVAQEPTMLAVSANPPSSNYGQAVMLTAVVAPITAQNHNATGTVTFTYGTTVVKMVGTSPIVNGVATFNTSMLPAGVDSVTATYSGDANFATSTGSVTETVNGSATVVTLRVAPSPAQVGQTVTLTAAVVGVSFPSVPTGSVTFYNGTNLLGQVGLDSMGSASFSIAGLPFGNYVLTAVYSGDAAFYTGTSPAVPLAVNGYLSATTLTAAPNPGGTGQPLTLTAGVTGIGSTAIATGNVTFYDGVTLLGTRPLDPAGHASFTTSALTLGTHSLTAVYAGSATYSGSTSAAYPETVQTPGFTITLASPALTLQTYHHTTTSVTLASAGDFADQVKLSCTSPPANVTCIFTPAAASLTANGSATVSFYIDTDSIIGGDARNEGMQRRVAPLFALLSPMGLFALLAVRRRRLSRLLLVALAVVSIPLALAVSGCGASVITPVPSTAPGVYTIAVTGTGATTGITHAANLTLTVTP